MHKGKEKNLVVLKMRGSFHITYLKGYNYHKHLTPLKITGKSLLLYQQKGPAFTQVQEKAICGVKRATNPGEGDINSLELHRQFFRSTLSRHYGTLTNFHLSTVMWKSGVFIPSVPKHTKVF